MLARGLSVLRCFRPGEPELQLSEIARRADMPKATAHRIISELVEEGMLERGEKGLRLGVALFMLGARVPRQLKLRSLAFPYAEQLHHVTRGSAFIFISDAFGPDAALVDAVRRAHGSGTELGVEDEAWASVQAATRIFHAFASGPVLPLAAAWGEAEGEAGRVRHQGFVAVRGVTGAIGIAAPVLTASSTAVGALAVTGPPGRLQVVGAVSHLRAACAAVSRALQRTPDMALAQ
ncbi:IclR family transcriptional regulator [Streptomyces subrutilus]|uniref:MarR family transcriptional regulator n=2 Tax=Streptomyces subrutilus TaxID=36818 RepID=A0A5P2UJ85_9ACTN|nr:helix-turn-helix domain-containing protein [Streptomyces subrutilus]QEU77761.1 MarR family transcriptional regulator [Streptomyces subrutilus]WSJ34367.1 helix-turn-helix domain-containing protein [Streptomyces subrutilus]